MIKITVPATTANMGCGFDTLGCALNLYATFTFSKSDTFKVTGCPSEYQNEDNLVIQAYKKVFEYTKSKVFPVSLTIDSPIPVSRGLGSSASCILGGILGANALLDHPLTKEECLKLAVEMEGHPDNVAPALLGSLCASFMDEKVITTQFKVSDEIEMLVMIPDFKVSTEKARELLPKQIDFKDAIYNLSRVTSLCKALETNNRTVIKAALKDRLHEPYRKTLIDEYDEVEKICENETAFFISGSGPTLICIPDQNPNHLIEKIKQLKNHWTCLILKADSEGAKEERV